jgi:hypothetical protein
MLVQIDQNSATVTPFGSLGGANYRTHHGYCGASSPPVEGVDLNVRTADMGREASAPSPARNTGPITSLSGGGAR